MLDRAHLDRAVEEHAARAIDLLERLVAQPSTVGHEAGAQEVLAAELDAAGFVVERLEIPEGIGDDPLAGVPSASYAGRYDLVGHRGPAQGRSLLINGHMDVVPADDSSPWSTPPFAPTVVDGWLRGRGAGDMKGGFASGMLAIWALDAAAPGWLNGPLTFVSAIEEEYTGNGTLASARAGHLADAAILLEPTELEILLAGIGIVWIGIEIDGRAAHAESAGTAVNPILASRPVIDALLDFERRVNAEHAADPDPVFDGIEHPYNLNIGTFDAGDWSSSVPAIARLGVRVGHPGQWTSEQALDEVREAVLAGVRDDPWLREHPPRFTLTGFRAERYAQEPDAAIVRAIAEAHADVHGSEPPRVSMGSTTDARLYVNRFGMPAAAYGPRTRNIHGTDEAVELDSIVQVAKAVARLLHDWYAA